MQAKLLNLGSLCLSINLLMSYKIYKKVFHDENWSDNVMLGKLDHPFLFTSVIDGSLICFLVGLNFQKQNRQVHLLDEDSKMSEIFLS